jgi:hypothetical protein
LQTCAQKCRSDEQSACPVPVEAALYGRRQLRRRFNFVVAERHADAALGQLHCQWRRDREPIFRNIHEKKVAAWFWRTIVPELMQNRRRWPLNDAQEFGDHPRRIVGRCVHVVGQRQEISCKPLSVDVECADAILEQKIDGVPESRRRDNEGHRSERVCYKPGTMKIAIPMAAAVCVASSIAGFAQVAPAPAGPVVPSAPAAAAAAATSSAAAKTEQELQKAEKDRFEAMIKADAGALDKLLAPELSYTHSNAQVQDKPGFISDIRSKVIRYVSIEPSDVHVTLFGTTAIVTGAAALHVLQNGTDLQIKIRYTSVQVNRRGEWQMAAWQATRVP